MNEAELVINNHKFTGWSATAILITLWMLPFFAGLALGISVR